MRDARNRENQILEEDGVVYGVYLAADFVAEHEFGINGLRYDLGLDRDPSSFAERCISRPFTDFVYDEGTQKEEFPEPHVHGKRATYKKVKTPFNILSTRPYGIDRIRDGSLRWEEDAFTVGGMWSDNGFALKGYGPQGMAVVRLILEGLGEGDLAVWVGGAGNNPFARGGLVIVRPSLTPQHLKDTMDAADQERLRLHAAADATGIRAKLDAAALRYFALSPRWITDDKSSAHPVMFWLNPQQQRENNFGWFTVEDLERWIEGKGPIPKEPVDA